MSRCRSPSPGIAVAFILAVIFSWNNFVFGIVLAGRETRTLPVAVYNMISFDQLSWGPLAAAALIVTLPGAAADGVRPAPDRRRADRGRRQGRVSKWLHPRRFAPPRMRFILWRSLLRRRRVHVRDAAV